MLVLFRRVGEKIQVGDDITIVVVQMRSGGVRIGVEAPHHVTIHREEVIEAIRTGETAADARRRLKGK